MKYIVNLTAILLVMIIACISAYGGDLQPPAGEPASSMVTLQEIYDRFDTIGDFQLLKTGQTTSYATGDDGELQQGVPVPSPRFTDNNNGTVTDNLTGLIWLKNANAAGRRNWATAISFVAQLNTDGTMNGNDCGDTSNGGSHQTDWRLPNRCELESLMNLAYEEPCISNARGDDKWNSNDPFTNVQSSYWSGTSYAGRTDYAWGVNMINGETAYAQKSSARYVWPIRGGID